MWCFEGVSSEQGGAGDFEILFMNGGRLPTVWQVWEGNACNWQSDASIQRSHHSKSAIASSCAVIRSAAFDGKGGGRVAAC